MRLGAFTLWLLSGFLWLSTDMQVYAAEPLVVIDPGHNPKQGGALSVRALPEVQYNDALSAQLAEAFKAQGWQVALTRTPSQSAELRARAELANELNATLFLSVHHDSAQLQYLKRVEYQGQPAYQTQQPIAGYSLFVAKESPNFAAAYRFAETLADRLQALGRLPTLHHNEPIAGENRTLLDLERGIYQFDELAVLRIAKVPAVLFEMGVIVDKKDEAWISDRTNQAQVVAAIVRAAQVLVE